MARTEVRRGRKFIEYHDPDTQPEGTYTQEISGTDDYVMIDPWDGHVGSFKSRYINPSRYIFRIVSYRRQ